MATPQQKDFPERPGSLRRKRLADFSYLNEAETDDYHAPTHEQYQKTAYQDKMLQPTGVGGEPNTRPTLQARREEKIARAEKLNNDAQQQQSQQINRINLLQRRRALMQKQIQAKKTLKEHTGRAKATQVNIMAFAWMTKLWLFFQIPLAIISIVVLGVVGFIDNVITHNPNEEAGWFSRSVSWVVSNISRGALAIIERATGIGLADIALPLYMIAFVLILGIGALSLLALYLQYTLSLLKPFSGEGAGLKIGLFLLAIIGYATPFANLLPWAFLWMFAVWRYPR